MESDAPRPSKSYNELIIQAIQSSEGGMMSLQDIYDYIQDSYDYFKHTTVVSVPFILLIDTIGLAKFYSTQLVCSENF